MSEKITGYTLLVIGIIVILFSAVNVYRVFTGKAEPVGLFNLEGISLDISQLTPQYELPSELEGFQNFQQTKSPEPLEIFPAAVMNLSMNLFVHIILMGFIASIGYKLASIGVMLTRPIVVKVKEASEHTEQPQQTTV